MWNKNIVINLDFSKICYNYGLKKFLIQYYFQTTIALQLGLP
jgi:hypothetical protein